MNYFPVKMSEYSKEVKSRYVTPFSIVMALIALANAYIYFLIYKAHTLGLICFICFLIAGTVPFLKSKTTYHVGLSNMLIVVFVACVAFIASFSGGVLSNAIWWLGAAPLVATFLLNAFFGMVWFFIIMVNFFLIFYLGQSDQLPFNILSSALPEGRMIVSFTLNSGLIAFLCILSDLIRDRVFLEKEELRIKMFQLNQVASLGKMASSVAHEINNPLTVIRGIHMRTLRMIETNEQIDKKVLADYMDKVHRNILRIQDVTGLMRTISDQARDRTKSSINLKQMLEDVIQMRAEDLQRYNITLQTQFPAEPLYFNGIFTEIFQAVLNVIDNAIYELKNSTIQPKTLSIELFLKNHEIRLLVEDNGNGIPTELRARVFDPFYRSKSFDDNKGLTLSFSHNILSNNGGTLELLNSTQGSRFQIILPRA